MKERIADFIREQAYKPMTFAELAGAMGIPEKQHVQLRRTLEQMEATGEVVRTRTERFGAPERMNLAVGRLQGHPKGFGFLVSDIPGAEDLFIGRESLNGAWHGDRIVARISPPTRAGARAEGEVIRILQRAAQRVVGTFEAAKHAGYVTPDDKRLPDDIIIPKGATNGARSGEKVVVQIVEYPQGRRNAEGKVVERIGMKGEVGVDIVSVIRKFNLPEAFPARVLREADEVPETVQEEAIYEEGRRDLRNWTIVTIDGEDAKDLDDAVNVERIGDGVWRLGVHIADVSYYVKEGSALDQDAYKRGTSVYLADRVVPMLPPRLSNGICSLNPHVDRLTLSCVMDINRDGKVLHYEIFPSVIKTVARMTYTKVNEILRGEADAIAQYEPLVPMFEEMHNLMQILRNKRERRGALDFDLPEAKVKLNERGWPIEIRRINRGISERIIEEFMLAANETVAEHCHRLDVPFMYRVHAEPAGDRLAGLRDFLGLFGYPLRLPQGNIPPKLLQSILDWAKGRPEENLIASVLLRTMKQAVYNAENMGHFGLAAEYYCHFTSPIRRYPDLVVHRVLRALMTPGMMSRVRKKWERWMPEAAQHSSDRERVAVEAERETVDLKKAEFMSDKVGETFEGLVSGVGQFGIFVQLPNTVEGLVHVSNMTDDYYHFHDKHYALIGERTRRRFRLGDRVVVRLSRVDIDTRQIDFALDEESPVVTVVSVPGETRQRAEKQRALGGRPPELPVLADKGGRNKRKRRKGKNDRGLDEGVSFTLSAPVLEEPTAEPEAVGFRLKKVGGKRVGEQPRPEVRELPKLRLTAPAEPVAEPRAKKGGRGNVKGYTDGARESFGLPQQPARARAPRREEAPAGRGGAKVDMWGVPVPEGRISRPRHEDDPGVINPFSISAPRNERGRRSKPSPESPYTPAPGTTDESAGFSAYPDTNPQRHTVRARRPRRAPRPRVRTTEE